MKVPTSYGLFILPSYLSQVLFSSSHVQPCPHLSSSRSSQSPQLMYRYHHHYAPLPQPTSHASTDRPPRHPAHKAPAQHALKAPCSRSTGRAAGIAHRPGLSSGALYGRRLAGLRGKGVRRRQMGRRMERWTGRKMSLGVVLGEGEGEEGVLLLGSWRELGFDLRL
ncbi:hypothetical protein K491DRAFT_100321 [Lophiostoma macrostomum CBS 122681]|uniref:Uncharacterized protein n=1 Tax=Lophiostoma macrostomum CBS 122681 TaxID=1314788 RepID=A0A6A6SW45_9PLEO|nr:hypothetical protein K491DRAFT_100321 [Lophiostoma macrostomum CBS 122681]